MKVENLMLVILLSVSHGNANDDMGMHGGYMGMTNQHSSDNMGMDTNSDDMGGSPVINTGDIASHAAGVVMDANDGPAIVDLSMDDEFPPVNNVESWILDEEFPTYMGCFRDEAANEDRDFLHVKFFTGVDIANNTVLDCANFCVIKGYRYVGLQGQSCYCDSSYGSYGPASEDECNEPCVGDADSMCGGELRNSVYDAVEGIVDFSDAKKPVINGAVVDDPELGEFMNYECMVESPNKFATGMEYEVTWYKDDVQVLTAPVTGFPAEVPFPVKDLDLNVIIWCGLEGRLGGAVDWEAIEASDPFYIGLEVMDYAGSPLLAWNRDLEIYESSEVQTISAMITYHLTEEITYHLSLDSSDHALMCGDEPVEQLKLGTCELTFNPENQADPQEIKLIAVQDGKVDGDQTVTLKLAIDGITSEVGVIVKDFDREGANLCSLFNDPHMTTFDGSYYDNHYEGEFILYRHTQLPFEVRAFFTSCTGDLKRATCTCAIIARAGDDLIILDKCDLAQMRTSVISKTDDDISPGFKLLSQHNGREYKILFPHGAEVKITMGQWFAPQFINAYMTPGASDFGQTEGLCGVYNDEISDDFRHSDGTTETGVEQASMPNDFSKSWRVDAAESLYGGEVPEGTVPYEAALFCSCTDSTDCGISAAIARCSVEDETDVTIERVKRDVDPIIFTYDDSEPEPAATWPSGEFTEEEAIELCAQAFVEPLVPGCGTEVVNFLAMCVDDIKMTGTADFVQDAVNAYLAVCDNEAEKLPGTVPEIRCLNDCNNHGTCDAQGLCDCESGWYSEDCSIDSDVTPILNQPVCCDVNQADCQTVTITGRGFINVGSDLRCILSPIQFDGSPGEEEMVPATYVTWEEVRCQVGETLSLPFSYNIAVSTRVGNPSEAVKYTIYDSVCMHCDKDTLEAEPRSDACLIENQCYPDQYINEENANLICDPDSHLWGWTELVENLCATAGCMQTCVVADEKAVCGCQTGFELADDMKSCTEINPCDGHGCLQGCTVDDVTGEAVCGCQDGFMLNQDGKNCDAVTPCATAGCEQTCKVENDEAVCGCQSGFELADNMKSCTVGILCAAAGCKQSCRVKDGKAECGCKAGLLLATDGVSCEANNDCQDLGCEHFCDLDNDGSVVCGCPEEFALDTNGKNCYGICAMSECEHECRVVPETQEAECYCRADFELSADLKHCDAIDKCQLAGCELCRIEDDAAVCYCNEGFNLAADNKRCVDVCETASCQHSCDIEDGLPVCLCRSGYKLDEDKVSCTSLCGTAGCKHKCYTDIVNVVAHCACNEGYELMDDQKTCQLINQCDGVECDQRCIVEDDKPKCTCHSGYDLDQDDLKTCHESNMCKEADCSHGCALVGDTVKCQCFEGMVLDTDEKTCIVENPCEDLNCEHHICHIDDDGQAVCDCQEGFILDTDGIHCNAVNLCQEAGCAGPCSIGTDDVTGLAIAVCSCETGFKLADDKKNCIFENLCSAKGCNHQCDVVNDEAVCSCNTGTKLAADGKTCEADNLCKEKNCEQECDVEDSEAVCSCQKGFILHDDGILCIAVCDLAGCEMACNPNDEGEAVCSCHAGYNIDPTDETQCVDIDECLTNNGGCSDGCENSDGSYSCTCPADHQLATDEHNCEDKCDAYGCESTCAYDFDLNKPVCYCEVGYKNDPSNDRLCIDVDECTTGNGGCDDECVNLDGSYICRCTQPGYYLQADEHDCKSVCEGFGCSQNCDFDVDTMAAVCACDDGFILSDDGKQCVDACDIANGGCEWHCGKDSDGAVVCSCPENSALRIDDKTCEDPCMFSNGGCGASAICSSENFVVTCSCDPPMYLNDDKKTCTMNREEMCAANNQRYDTTLEKCVDTCVDHDCAQNCRVSEEGVRECYCNVGYELDTDEKACNDIDECAAADKGGCSDICENTPGSYICKCPHGHTLDSDQHTCLDTDECATDNGGCGIDENCINEIGGHHCECKDGYKYSADSSMCVDVLCIINVPDVQCKCPKGYRLAVDDRTCIDIDECATNNGGCSMDCLNIVGSYSCECRVTCVPGYRLEDENQCVDMCLDYGCSHGCAYDAAADSPVCSCPKGYALDANERTCVDACDVDNGGCEWKCEKDDNEEVVCTCPENSDLKFDEKNCEDPCMFSNGGCSGGAICTSENFVVTCSCERPYNLNDDKVSCTMDRTEACKMNNQRYDTKLDRCVDTCINHDCDHECHLIEQETVRECYCHIGYELDGDGKTCNDINECDVGTDGCEDICVNTDGSYTCQCSNGDLNTDSQTCTTIDVCETNNGGCEDKCEHLAHKEYRCVCETPGYVSSPDDHHLCVSICYIDNGGCAETICSLDAYGKASCSCPQGKTMLSTQTLCVDNCNPGYTMNILTGDCTSQCDVANGGCDDGCRIVMGRVACSCNVEGKLAFDGKTCVACDEGYELAPGTYDCVDTNECEDNTHECEQDCTNTVGGYDCSCHTGDLATDGTSCSVVDLCKIDNGNCAQDCVHVEHRQYRCECRPGYELDSDLHTCVSECDINNGECDEKADCSLRNGEATCQCPNGYVLDDDQKSCKDICETGVCDQLCSNVVTADTPPPPYTCSCRKGYVMEDGVCIDGCELDGKQGCSHMCINNKDDTYTCSCPDDMQLSQDYETCEDKDECADKNGGCSDECVNEDPGYHCACPNGGDLGIHGKHCIFEDLCATGQHECVHDCEYIDHKQYKCLCDPGYELADDDKTCINLCHVNNGGCDAVAKCNIAVTGIVCTCPDGYRLDADGKTCLDINECEVNADTIPCTGDCENTIGSYKCTCPYGYHLATDGFTCTDMDECLDNNGGCSDKCVDVDGTYTCECTEPNFVLVDKHICTHVCDINKNGCEHRCVESDDNVVSCECNEGWKLHDDGKNCEDIDESTTGEHDCEQIVTNAIGGYTCSCNPGYELKDDGKSCTDIDECLDDKAGCSDECENSIGSYSCKCPAGYELDADLHTCKDIKECSQPGKAGCTQQCIEENGSYHCDCDEGYELTADYHTCTDIPECDTNKGGCDHSCAETPGGFLCKCNTGYVLNDDGKTCDNIDECLVNNGGCEHECEDNEGGFTCSCLPGYVLSVDKKTCKDINECETDSGGCKGPGTCVNTVGSHHCECNDGYRLDFDERTCIDKNECDLDEDECGHICHNAVGSYSCSCMDGYTLSDDGKTCTDNDECSNGESLCMQGCVNEDGTYTCTCSIGYELNDDGYACDEIDRCADDNGGCDQGCTSTLEKPVCSCNEGFTLNEDGVTCDDIDECAHDNGGCRQFCRNLIGTYRCECEDNELCRPGYLIDELTDQCRDVDECSDGEDNCEQQCTNTKGAFVCSCDDGYDLNDDGYSCQTSTATTTIASPQPWTGDPDDVWGEWGEFGPCSVSCHGGEQMRSRKNHMTSDTDSEKRNCNVDVPCDGIPDPYAGRR